MSNFQWEQSNPTVAEGRPQTWTSLLLKLELHNHAKWMSINNIEHIVYILVRTHFRQAWCCFLPWNFYMGRQGPHFCHAMRIEDWGRWPLARLLSSYCIHCLSFFLPFLLHQNYRIMTSVYNNVKFKYSIKKSTQKITESFCFLIQSIRWYIGKWLFKLKGMKFVHAHIIKMPWKFKFKIFCLQVNALYN